MTTQPQRTITCPRYTASAGSRRCLHFIANGGCSLPDELMCVEFLKANPAVAAPRSRANRIRSRRIYICHPFDAPGTQVADVRAIAADLLRAGYLPFAPHLYMPAFLSDAAQRQTAHRLCLELLEDCDEVRVFGHRVTPGMRAELERAAAVGVPVVWPDSLGEPVHAEVPC